ncbi:MAG: response regulator [Deltaproteobacteria bacterium]|nr:response regulator [Deltaproteobacteria bacterium]
MVFLFLVAAVYVVTFKPRLDAWFDRQAYDRRQVRDRHEREMVGIKTPDEVLHLLRDTLTSTLQPVWIRLWTKRFESDWSESAWPEGESPPEGWGKEKAEILGRTLLETGVAVERGQLEKDQDITEGQRVLLRWMIAWDAYSAFCLCGKDQALGFVFLGERKSLKSYTRGDLELLDSISASTYIGLANAFLFDRVDAQRSDLEDLTVNLEKRVAQRTEEIDEANKQLRSGNERLRELDRVKSQFFANISHELRTPLSLILAPLDSLLDGSVGAFSSDQIRHLESMQRNGMQLFRMIEDLLDLCLLEDSRLRLNIESLDLNAFLGRLVDTVGPLAERKSIALALSVDGEISLEVDAEKLERILTNLLGNALKFTEENGRVSLEAGEEGEGVWIKVVDDGCGIAVADQPNIFERFNRGAKGRFRPQGGAGIGLALALELSELHGGSLKVESEAGVGSTFTLRLSKSVEGLPEERIERRLSRRDVAEERRSSEQGLADWGRTARQSKDFRLGEIERATERRVVERLEGTGPKAARVLLVDDNKDLLQYLHTLLSERYEVWPVQDGAQALSLLRKHRHELVLADVMMPGMSGLELCHRIKSDPAFLDVPVVLLTARSGQEHRMEGHGVGADQYLTKPFKPKEVLAVLDRLLKGRSRSVESSAWRRSASLDSLLAGMAHELRNACHQAKSAQVASQRIMEKGIGDMTSMQEPANASRLQSMAAIVERALDRIERVVNSLQDYAGERMDAPWSSVSLKAMLKEEIPGLALAESKSAKVELDLDAGAIVRGPAEALRQAVINLVENALHAVGPGGRVQVRTLVQAGEVSLVVEDDGCGIPPEQKDAIFDLFFTTRAPGQGTGMGLALAKKTIEEMGGSLSVESQVGEGSRFTATFPKEMVAEQAEQAEQGEMR